MSMPQIPEEKNRPSLCEVTIDLLKSVALEETALSHILNAEGERSQALVKKYEHGCCELTYEELDGSVRQTERMLNAIIMKEWLLLKKLETAYEINQKLTCKPKEKEKEKCNDCFCCRFCGCEIRITDCNNSCKCSRCCRNRR